MTQITDCTTGLVFSKVPEKWKNLAPKTLTYNVGRFGIPCDQIYELMDRVIHRQKRLFKYSIDTKKVNFEDITFAICFDNFKKMRTLYRWIVKNKLSIQTLQKYKIFIYLISPNNLDRRLFCKVCWEFDDLIYKPEEKQKLTVYSRDYSATDMYGNVKDVSKYFRYSE